jgi:signal recognition particle receptor subunit beta
MSSVNLHSREISIKVVYYGPGLGGKTTSLQHIHKTIKPESRGQLVSLSTGVDRTLYFDFLPVRLPKLRGFNIRVQLYTVPGQVHYNSTRKLVLTGADGVVFVADSQEARFEANIESLENLLENLREQGMTLDDVPHVIQYNKRDVPDLVPLVRLEAALNAHRVPYFETCATTGKGVYEALKSITTLVLSDLRRRGVWRAEGAPAPAAPEGEAAPAEIKEESSDRWRSFSSGPISEGSIEASLQALADKTSQGAPAAAGEAPLPELRPLEPEGGVVIENTLGRTAALSEILPAGPARDAVVAVEFHIQRGDWAGAIVHAGRAFDEAAAARVDGDGGDAAVMHAFSLGLRADRYLRFREVMQRAATGRVSSGDALYALFFLVDAVLR